MDNAGNKTEENNTNSVNSINKKRIMAHMEALTAVI